MSNKKNDTLDERGFVPMDEKEESLRKDLIPPVEQTKEASNPEREVNPSVQKSPFSENKRL